MNTVIHGLKVLVSSEPKIHPDILPLKERSFQRRQPEKLMGGSRYIEEGVAYRKGSGKGRSGGEEGIGAGR